MKQRDFHAGQSALGLMARNTEAMFAPRMAQWEAFGKGFQDANAIVQNRHAFNEQLAQNQKQNEFKEREFGFREREAEESNRRFDTQMRENQRRFDQRHALDKQNSATDRAYKGALTAFHYFNIDKARKDEENARNGWLIAEELKKKWALDPNNITLYEKSFLQKHGFDIDDSNNTLAVKTMNFHKQYNQNEKVLRNALEALQGADLRGIAFGIKRKINEGTGGFIGELDQEESKHIVAMNNLIDAAVNYQYGNNTSGDKYKRKQELLDLAFQSPKQFKNTIVAMADDVFKQQEADLNVLREYNLSDESLKKYTDSAKENRKAFEAFAASKGAQIQMITPLSNQRAYVY